MTVRLLLGVVFVANILVLVLCTESTQATATSVSSANETSSSSYASSSSSAKAVVKSKPAKCRKAKKCPKNEEFSNCPESIQRAQYCSEKAEPSTYRSTADKPCKKGCVCKENYLRAENGTCLPADQCPITCGTNEVLDKCPADCQSDYCPTEEDTEAKPCVTPDVCPPPVCKCAFNHRRDCNGSCIPTKDCPPFTCRTNEEYNPCPPLCPTDDCSQASPTGECPPQFGHIGIILPCNPKCRCIKDYWRLDGICVPYGQCPGVCPANERYSGCIQAECRALNCTQKDQSVPCIRLDPKFCKTGCVCEEGYLRNQDGICVLEDKCEPPITCGTNEVLDKCPADCQSDYCPTDEDTEAKPCVSPDVCPPPVCKCAFNHRRDCNGSCIPTKDCPPFACRTNEEYNPCPPLCPTDDCSQASPTGECPPQFGRIGIVLPCNPKCRCIKDYWRLDGKCVPYGQCPGVCPDNERYSTCVQAECRALNCTQKDQSVPCIDIDPKFCEKGCVCEEGYLRNKDGICVLEDKCEPGVCPDNERYSTCVQAECRALNCTQKDQSVPCIRMDPTFCEKGCVCEEGYLRNKDGICVLEDKCEPTPSCTSANEEFVQCIQGVCRAKNCSQKGEDVPCPDIPAEECDSGCICKERFLRAPNGTCVPEDQCETNKCPPFEEWNKCSNAVCRSEFCYQKGLPVACPSVSECAPGCLCQYGYLREESGVCVPEKDCKPNPCPLNEVLSNCTQAVCRTQNCTDRGKPVVCPLVAEGDCEEGCVCKEGYLRVEDGLYCVPDDECNANKCPLFEVWDDCSNAACRAENCTQKGLPVSCPSVTECVPGCLCRPGYLRQANGFCVPEEDCNTPITCGENEVLDNCSLSCNSDNCPKSADEEQVCTQSDPCVPACKCEFNYKRAENGTCIPTRDCPPFDCSAKPNEEFVACPPFCPTDECGKPRLEGRCPFIIGTFLQCNPKCQCIDGYGRVNGTCVPFEECPDLCPANEVYTPCVQETCRPQNCSDRDVAMETCPTSDAASCQRGCVCQENYYRNETGVCVSYEECGAPETCGENEVLDDCPMKCNSDNCPKSANEAQVCTQPDPCVPACKCRFNYKRAENGTCIPTRDCPPFDCSAKPNEKFVACPPICPTDECGKPRLEGRCPFRIGIVLQCKPKCQCMDGYGRSNGTCVPFEECPGLCPANEVYSSCVQQTCRPQNCSDRDLAIETCPTSDTASCQRGCVCQENYYRNDKGVCISYKECGGPMCPNEHEEYTPNFKECPSNTCQSLVVRHPCDENQKEGPGCICESGYLRINVTSACIPICDCPEMKYSPDC